MECRIFKQSNQLSMQYKAFLLYFGIPYFAIILGIELIYTWRRGDRIRFMDAISSISLGMTNLLKISLGIGITIISYGYMLSHFRLHTWEPVPVWIYAVCFLYLDFMGYWVHRIEHRVNFFWNEHLVHHCSEEYNLLTSLRQPISNFVGFFTIFSLPLAVFGVPVEVIAIVAPVQLFLQYWYHTRYIGRIGLLEKVIVSPSHHRVHHAMNGVYLDKNFGQIFIIWDRLFGTYQEELTETEPVYGIRRPVRTWNPFLMNFKHLYLLILDAWRTASYRDKLRIWFMPTGWRPADVAAMYPVATVEDMGRFEKFDPVYSRTFQVWAFIQMSVTLMLLGYFFYRMGQATDTEKLLYGAFLFVSVFAYTSVMDRRAYGIAATVIQALLGTALIVLTGDWLGMKHIWPTGPILLIVYFGASVCGAVYFQLTEFSRRDEVLNA